MSVMSSGVGDSMPFRFARMVVDDISTVETIENTVYPYPWTRGNFLDSLYSNYETWVLWSNSDALVGYFLLMPAVDEAHLLNVTVRRDLHGTGIGRYLLDRVCLLSRQLMMTSVLLEVRPSNHRALAIYERYGFSKIALRKNYYPAPNHTREDAIVMRLPL